MIKVQRRPLALAQRMILAGTGSPNPAFQRDTHAAHRSSLEAAWLDLDWPTTTCPMTPNRASRSSGGRIC
jgi:hypothetical protein